MTTGGLTERIDEPGWKLWVFLEGDRRQLAAGIALVIFLVLVTIGVGASVVLRDPVITGTVLGRVFQSLTVALITGVTLVVTINQLVLSQEIGAVADQRTRIEGSMQFREDVVRTIEEPAVPARPGAVFSGLVAEIDARTRAFGDAARAAGVDDEARTAFVDGIIGRTEDIRPALEDAQFGTYEVLSPVLGFDYSARIVEAEQLEATNAAAFDLETSRAHDDLITALELFGLAREHFKTLYFQWALIDLSRSVLVLFVPALLVTVSMLLFVDPEAIDLMVFGVDGLVAVVALAIAVSVSPFLLIVTYLLRVATIAKRTLAIGPFVLR